MRSTASSRCRPKRPSWPPPTCCWSPIARSASWAARPACWSDRTSPRRRPAATGASSRWTACCCSGSGRGRQRRSASSPQRFIPGCRCPPRRSIEGRVTQAALNMRSATERRSRPATILLTLLGGGLLGTFLLSVGTGAVAIGPGQTLAILARQIDLDLPWISDPMQEIVLLTIRLPRACLSVLVGAALAVSGAALQGLFRNPLAHPRLTGTPAVPPLSAPPFLVPVVATAVPPF